MKKLLLSLTVLVIASIAPNLSGADFPALEKYIQTALGSNLKIKQAYQNIRESHAAHREAYFRFFPTLDFESRYSYSGGGRKIVIDPSEFLSGNLPPGIEVGGKKEINFLRETEHDTRFSLQQPLFTGGMIRNSYNASEMKYRATQSEYKQVKEEVIEEISRGYFNYLMTLRLKSVARSNLELAEQHLRVAKSLYQAEKVSQAEVFRAEVAVSSAQQALAESRQQVVVSRTYFNNILNRPPGDSIEVDQLKHEIIRISLPVDELADISDYRELAENNRAELDVVRYNRSSLEYLRKVRKAEYYPRLSLGAVYGWQGEKLRFDFPHDYWTVSLLLQFNVFDWGARGERVKQVEAQIDNLSYVYDDLRRGIELQVTRAYQNLMTLVEKWNAARQQLKSARENLRITEIQYNQGLASQITYLDAQNELTRAQSNLVIVYYECLSARASLDRACGVGHRKY